MLTSTPIPLYTKELIYYRLKLLSEGLFLNDDNLIFKPEVLTFSFLKLKLISKINYSVMKTQLT